MEIYEGNGHIVKNAKIKVIGVGGGGNNAINRMIDEGITDIEFIALNTDYNVLANSKANRLIQLGQKLTRGLGAGGSADVGRKSAEETKAEIEEAIEGADLVFITAGMGGGTGTGAAPIVAEIAKTKGILTIGVVTTPFGFEGRRRMQSAIEGVTNLKKVVDSLIVIPNEKLKEISDENLTFKNAFKKADEILVQGVRGIYDIIYNTSELNVDFADICTITRDKGVAHMGIGSASGKNKTELALKMAINSPLLDTSIAGAKSVLVNVVADESIGLNEVYDSVSSIGDYIHPDANIIFGLNTREDLEDMVSITVIATELDDNAAMYNDNAMDQIKQLQMQSAQLAQMQNQTNQGNPMNQTGQFNTMQTGQFNTQQGNPMSQTGQYNNPQFDTSQLNRINYDTNPSIQPVNYESDIQQNQRTNHRFKIHGIFQGAGNDLPDINR